MQIVEVSDPPVVLERPHEDLITLYTQFYLPADATRLTEVKCALLKNAQNKHLDRIVLLNERVYTTEELGVESEKITQVVLGRRLEFADFFDRPELGYKVLVNADIFLDDSIVVLKHTDLHVTKTIFAQLRMEYRGEPDLRKCPVFGPRPDSMDTWVIHSNHPVNTKALHFALGRPGCDNKLCYIFYVLGFQIHNAPLFFKSYHNHSSEQRSYLPRVDPPYALVYPHGFNSAPTQDAYSFVRSNANLKAFIGDQLEKKKPFVVPRISGVENITALNARMNRPVSDALKAVMKNNAGIKFTTKDSVRLYSNLYLKAFEESGLYACWEPWGHYIKHIEESHKEVLALYARPMIWAYTFDIYHYLDNPWTHALAGKRLLIVSPFCDLFKKQPQAYKVDLFPQCTFVYVKPPVTQGQELSRNWVLEFQDLCDAVAKEEFDVALCSCGGYGNPLCGFIKSKLNKSAIYVGGVLQMYFGVYGERWVKETPDILKMHMHSGWCRPNQKPLGHENIEKGCYW